MADYRIDLGIGLNQSQLNQTKQILESIENQKRDVVYNVDFNIKNVDKLKAVSKEIEDIRTQLNTMGSTGKSKNVLPIDTKAVEKSLGDIHSSIKKLQNAFGKVDNKKGVQSLLTTVNKISTALDKVSKQFVDLNRNLTNLSAKDFSFNFDLGFGKSGKNPEQTIRELNMLKKEVAEYEKYFRKLYSLEGSNTDPINKLLLQYNQRSQVYGIQLQSAMNKGSDAQKVAAHKEYLKLIKDTAAIGNIALEPVEFKLAESGEFIRVRNEANETEKQLKELFSGGIDADNLHRTLKEIADDLNIIKQSLTVVSSEAESPINKLTQSFNRLSESMEQFVKNANLAKNALGDGLGNSVDNSGTEKAIQDQKELSQAIIQTANEAKKLDNISINIPDGNVDELSNALKNLKLDDTSIENTTKELNELNIVAKNVSGTFKDGQLIKLDIEGVQTVENGLERVATITKTLGQDGWISSEKYSQALDKIAIAAEKVNKKLHSGSKGHTKFDVEIGDVEQKFNNLSNQSTKLQSKIKLLKEEFVNIQNAASKGVAGQEELIAANKRYEVVLEDVRNQLKLNQQAEQAVNGRDSLAIDKQNALLRLKNLFGENSEAAKKFASELNRLQREIDECGDAAGLRRINKEITNLGARVKEAGVKTQTFGHDLKEQFSKYSSYFGVAELFMWVEQGLRDMFEQVKLIDTAMTELKKVTDETDASYNQFLRNAASRSKELGTTIDGLVSSTADFARLGYGFEESQGLAEVANVYAVVGDEIDGVEGATESLVSTLAAFKDELSGISDTDFAMDIIDKFNEVSNNFAISSGGIGEAMQRSASSLRAANNTIDESIALITAANTVVQDPTVVGTAFKTISMRIRGAKTELEEAGLETEGMVESTATLRAEIEALTGVDIMKNANEFKSTYQIMDELAAKWQDLTDIQQASVTELIAGKRQGNIVSSLMQNFDTARDALETSLNSSGSAMREHEKWSQSLEARLNKLKSTWQSLSQSFMSSDFLKSVLDGVIALVNGLDKLIDTVGTLPTLLGVVAGGLSAFKNKGLFIFDKDAKSIQLFNSSFKDLGGEFKKISTGISTYNSTLTKSKGLQDAYVGSINRHNSSFGKYLSGLNGAKASMGGYIASLVGAKVASFALQAATIALNAAITMGVSFLISGAISLIQKWINAKEELAEKVDEVTSKFKEQHTELVKNKSSFESQATRYSQLAKGVNDLGENVSLTADEYTEYQDIVNSIADQVPSLIQGYDAQGNAILNYKGNVEELTAAYEDLIKKQNDSVLKGDAYKDIEKDFKNAMEDAKSGDGGFMKTKASLNEINALEALLKSNNLDELIPKLNEKYGANISYLINELESAGIDKMKIGESYDEFIKRAVTQNKDIVQRVVNDFNANLDAEAEGMRTAAQAALSNAFDFSDSEYKNISDKTQSLIRQIVGNFDAEQFDKIVESGKTVEEYINSIINSFKNMSKGEASSLEAAFNLQTKFNGGDISYGEYIQGIKNAEELIDGLNIDDEVKNQIKLTLNTDEVTDNYEALKKRLTEKYELNMETEKAEKKAEKFLNGLSVSEYQVAIDLIDDEDVNFDDFDSIKELRKYIKEQAKLTEAMNYTIAMDIEIENLDALNTAMAESVSGAGLSSEAIAALKGRYAELEGEGYNLSAMFEETANGIHLNREAVSELEQKLASDKLAETDKHLEVLKGRYDELTTEIDNCTDASERAALYTEQQSIIDKINDLGTLAAQYEGLTSAYNAWQKTEESGSERDMYEKIIEGFETVDDEIKRGWTDDGTIKFLELLTGKTGLASKSGKELKEIYDSLDKKIGKSKYSISDFFTVNKDGESTNTGVYNFLETIESFGGKFKEAIKRDDKGNIIEFDFKVAGGDEVIAETLGISEELVQIMLRAADDAGFVVNLEGAYTQLADLKTKAETARDTLISLKKDGLEQLKGVKVNFNLDAEGDDLVKEQKRAVKLLDKFKKDGKIDLKMEGAQQALDIAEYLTIKLDDLTEPKIMQIDVSEVDEGLRDPIEKMQEIVRLSKEKNLVSLTGDKKKIKETQKEINKVAKELEGLDPEVKAKVGIDENWDSKTIADKIAKGEIEIPAELELDVQMSDDLKDMRLMMMKQLGLVEDEEVKLKIGYDIDDSTVDKLIKDGKAEVVLKFINKNEKWFKNLSKEKQEIAINLISKGVDLKNLDDDKKTVLIDFVAKNEEWFTKLSEDRRKIVVELVSSGVDLSILDGNQKEVVIKYIEENKDVFDSFSDEEKKVVVKYVAKGKDLDKLTEEEKEIIVKLIGDDSELKDWTPEQKEAMVKYIVDGGDVDDWSPEQKQAWARYLVDHGDIDGWTPEMKQAWAQYLVDGSDVEGWTPEMKEAYAKYIVDGGDVTGYTPEDKKALAKYLVDGGDPSNYQPPSKTQNVKADLDSSEPDNYQPPDKTMTVKARLQKTWSNIKKALGIGEVNGTANVDGTAFVNGTNSRAFKQGDWRTKKSETALTGELGRELVVTGNRWYTVGDNGAEFTHIPKGSIVFNHKQTEELFKNGKVTSNGGRGRLLANGTAHAHGTAYNGIDELRKEKIAIKKGSSGSGGGIKVSGSSVKIETKSATVDSRKTATKDNGSKSTKEGIDKVNGTSAKDKTKTSTSSKSKSSSSSSKDDFEETFDWIEVKTSRLERAIDRLDKKASGTWRSWTSRNKALTSEISKVNEEINLQEKAYSAYMKEANSVGLSSSWKKKVQNGTLDISTVKDEKLAEKIKKYQEYYEKALECKDAVLELKDTEAELNKQKFDNIVSKYDAKIGVIDNNKSLIEQNIEQSQYTTSVSKIKGGNYKKLVAQEQKAITQLEAKKKDLQSQLDKSVANGSITKYSEDWYAMREEIYATTLAIKESTTNVSKYYSEAFDQINSKYDGILQGYEHTETMLNEYIAQAEAQGYIVSDKYYKKLISNEKSNIKQLKKQQADLVAARDEALESGAITRNSAEWYRMSQEIDAVTQEIESGTTALIEYNNALRDIEWEKFDLKMQGISDVNEESDFLIELLSNKDLYDDKGKLTGQGAATLGLHGLNHNTYMYAADEYAKEIADIDRRTKLSESDKDYLDPNSKDVIDRRRELVKLQRESILAAEGEKKAIQDLVQEGIDKELDALQELIDKKKESLQSEKDLYDYQKKVKEQTKEIASLEKQMAAYSGDDSEEARQKIQTIKVELEAAKENLQETEYDKYISDQEKLLDNLYVEYETILNTRLDNIDGLLEQVVAGVNAGMGSEGAIATALGNEGAIALAVASAIGENGSIKSILNTELSAVGSGLSQAMSDIWGTEGSGTNAILATYGQGFQDKLTTTNTTLDGIKIAIDNMVSKSDEEAQEEIKKNSTTTSAKKDPTVDQGTTKKDTATTKKDTATTKKSTTTKKATTTTKTTTAKSTNKGDGDPEVGDKVKFVSGEYYYSSDGQKPKGSKNLGKDVYITKINMKSWATHPYHISTGKKLGSGDLGWLKLKQLKGYASGKKNFLDDEIAWTQEKGQEFIVRPSDGAILTPVAKGDSVLNATASGNIWSMANNPAEFIKNNLGLDNANIPNAANVNNNCIQNFDKVIFNMPNVHSYDEMLRQMQKDKSFEKLILAMTIDRVTGGSALAKGKAIR